MKYSVSVEIEKPLEEVVSLFDNRDNYKHWMEGLLNLILLEGESGQTGAKSEYTFKMGKGEMKMVETVTSNNLPDEYAVSYTAKGVSNTVVSRFSAISANRTKYTTENEFQFSGFMKIIAFLMPGSFKKQSLKYLTDFKKFAEQA
ncbi:MAG: SRPBCC family protein [Cyanothece sp. SIO1E1]|nr:SRPBCC family protein [Cyanothece sp. SIO1E1]